jgi:cytochrome c oxidase subunit 2
VGRTDGVFAQLEPAGPAAAELADLWWVLFGLGTAIYVMFLVLLGWPLLRRRARAKAPAADDGSELASRVAQRWIVAGGVVLPAVVLPVALGFSVAAMHALPSTAPRGSIVVEVVGFQWWWSVRYPAHGITTANEIHIPVGQPVELRLSSADVIHSFWVPSLAGKIDALPDHTNVLVIEADRPGEYRGQCAEFCGLQHAKMNLLVIAQPADEFAAWLAQQQAPARSPTTPTAARGQEVFLRSGCGSCHAVSGVAAGSADAPDLTHFGSRRTLAAGTLTNSRDALARWLRDPDDVKEGTPMAPTALSDQELDELLAYLETQQ